MQRVRDVIKTEYDEDEDLQRNPTPAALHDFVQKIKLILEADAEKTGEDQANVGSNRNDNVSASSSSESYLSQHIGVGNSNSNSKVIEALGNHVVLTEIFKCGSFRDLKYFRLVNKQWKGIANSAIIQRRLWKLKLKDILYGERNGNIVLPLLKLNECIEASGGSFPLTTLDFSDMETRLDWIHVDLFHFYNLMGESIKRVVFNNSGPLTVNEVQDLLVDKMPNVDHIDAGKIVFADKKYCPLSFELPNLKTIRFIANKSGETFEVEPYYKDLLIAARNLTEIQDFHIYLTNIVSETGKMSCIQKLEFALELLATSSELYVKLSHFKPKLTSLSITTSRKVSYTRPELSSELVESLKRILISSKDSLKHLQCMPDFCQVDFVLPKFSNLEYLTVSDRHDPYYRRYANTTFIFPPGYNCSEIFPKVHTVFLRLCPLFKTTCKYFPGQALPSVKTLEFQEGYQFEDSFKLVFPNVSYVKIINYHDIVHEAKRSSLCFLNAGINSDLGNGVESLEFHQCRLWCAFHECAFDSRFTGAPRRSCRKLLLLYNQRKARGEDEDIIMAKNLIETVRTLHGGFMFPNYAGLRRLKIIFDHPDNVNYHQIAAEMVKSLDEKNRHKGCKFACCNNYCTNQGSDVEDDEDTKWWTPVITPVSCVYGFSLMPNLEQVVIGYDHNLPNAAAIAQVFEPFAEFSYVKIVHEPTNWNDYRK